MCTSILKVIQNSFFTLLLTLLAGCQAVTYPDEKIASSIQEICRKEYGIEHVDVKIVGRTIGVFLPLKKLFTMDVRHLVVSGQVENLESLFEPDPEAMNQLEDVLFAISRVMLSTDRPIDFYELRASDVEGTGLELVLKGYIPDVRRVRLWDIPRSEYRKRVIHELKLNRPILWEKPVRDLFSNIGTMDAGELGQRYFSVPPSPETVSGFFYDFLTALKHKQSARVELVAIRSHPFDNLQALVYAKVRETFERKPGTPLSLIPYSSGTEFEYIFIVQPAVTEYKIVHVIPFHYLDEMNQLRPVSFPRELALYQNIDAWSERFAVEEIFLGEFLALQLNRRVQGLLTVDERVRLTINLARLQFIFRGAGKEAAALGEEPRFELYFNFVTKSMQTAPMTMERVIGDEDVLYVLEAALREFVLVIRSYRFTDYDRLELIWEPAGASQAFKISPDELDLFRRKKRELQQLLGATSHLPSHTS